MTGFFVFFFAGFKVSAKTMEELAKKIPILVAVIIPLGCFAVCYYFFSQELVSFTDNARLVAHFG